MSEKDHGTGRWIEGYVNDKHVAVVDDVITTGNSVIKALHRCREEGLYVVQVIVLVDREEGGLEKITSYFSSSENTRRSVWITLIRFSQLLSLILRRARSAREAWISKAVILAKGLMLRRSDIIPFPPPSSSILSAKNCINLASP